ncbi:Zinc finger C2H2-type [Cinara cedri]|uniref:Zinc finger C2H2-type n=1 Tax=Cinara cedri TaxID=506608 RepID=A0A5E4MYT2_9HEMI|nr:Zinc finger C2H2-type [Cinara cedri]
MYQCIFCLFGSEFNDLMMNHLAMEHFEYESVCLERSLKSDSLDSSKVENLKIIRLTQTIDSGLLEIVNVTPEMSFLLENPEMLDDNDEVSAKRKLSVEHLSQESIDWPRNKRQRKMSVEHLTEESNDGPNKFKQTVFPFIELNKLFVCKECDKVFLNSKDYQRHLENFPKSNEHKKCVFCDKYFKTPYQMTEHVKCHGPDRFTCNICYFMAPSCQSIGFHMKNEHEIGNLELIPVNSKCTDIEIDKFIVDRKKYKKKKYQKILPKECNISFKCGECLLTSVEKNSILSHIKDIHNIDKYEVHKVNSSSIGGFKELYEIRKINSSNEQIKTKRLDHNNLFNQNIDKNDSAIPKVIVEDKNTKQFSPDTIDNIPMTHIFLNPIGCSLCTYNTKVRSNLILHLNIHKNGQCIITKEIVNPVPSIENSELMFDKMINLSASSYEAMISEKTKVDKLNTKIVEVSPINNLNTELFPQFIPKNKLFQCSEGTCNQQFFLNADLLKTHMSIIHEDFQFYLCPHCQPNSITTKEVKINNIDFHLLHHTENLFKCQYCDYIDFNRDEMRKHMRKTHLPLIVRENQYNIIVIRQSKIEDYSFDRNIIEGDANSKQFEEHFKEHHPNVADKNQKVCDKITDAEQLAIQSNNHMGNTINNQEQRALESIDPRMPLSCRGIPIESNYTSESRFVSKNPKSAKQSQVKIKPEMFQNDFKEDDRLGSISKSGQFVCPKCNSFTTKSIKIFRDHLYKEIDSKKWKCMKCFLICNSAQKMSWHIKKHEFGTKYEKMENTARFKWVDRVIEHQYHLSIEFNKQKTKDIISVGRTVAVTNKMTLKTKKDFSPEKKVVDSSITPQMSVEVINLLNDFDDE